MARRRLWTGIAFVAAALIVANSLAPQAEWVAITQDVAGAAAVVAIWIAVPRRDRESRMAWAWLAIALTCWVLGDLVWDGYTLLGRERPDVSFADALYLVGYPAMALGLFVMARRRAGSRLREGLLDGVAFGVGAAIMSWQLLAAPLIRDTQSLLTATTWAAYPLFDALLIAALGWLLLTPGRRSAPTILLFASLAVTLVADILYAGVPLIWESFDTSRLDPLFPIAYMLIMGAALDANADELTAPCEDVPSRMHTSRVVLLGTALFIAPILIWTNVASSTIGSRLVLFLASSTVCAIVLARFTMAVREREITEDELAHRATHDDLTGLVNRTLLIDRINSALARSRRSSAAVAVLYVDLDGFKNINDAWGHAVGDIVLTETASRLRSTIRPGDTVARVGGDEFVVVCEHTGLDQARAVADRIHEAATPPIRIGELNLRISASIGIAIAHGGALSAEDLVRDGDTAMYVAKREGRSRSAVFDSELRIVVNTRRDMEAALSGALVQGELDVAYQPMIRLGSDDVVAFEALARWNRPGIGPIAPSEFIALAEDAGLILQLGEWMLQKACERIAAWTQSSDAAPLISVNVSAKQFVNRSLTHTIDRVLAATGADPTHLMLEITESVLVGDIEQAVSQLRTIKALGVRIAVDDFGTGYSALAYLRRFPIDVVKIDRVFVQQLREMSPAATLINAVVELAHALGYTVVVEGVENKDQLDALRAIGCDWAQGFYLAPPLTEEAATRIVRDGSTAISMLGAATPLGQSGT